MAAEHVAGPERRYGMLSVKTVELPFPADYIGTLTDFQSVGKNIGSHDIVGIEKMHPFGLYGLKAGLTRLRRSGTEFRQYAYGQIP